VTDPALGILDETIAATKAHLAELEAKRAALAGRPYFRSLGEAVQPREETDLIELHIAAQRFGVVADTIRLWCRTERIGKKRGGRWLVSISRLRARLGLAG
jgi:hypothetical protein